MKSLICQDKEAKISLIMAKILDVKIDDLSSDNVMSKIAGFLSQNKLHQIATVNPEFLLEARKDQEFKNILNNTDLNVPDGIGLKFAAKILGQKIGQRITGVDLTYKLAQFASKNNYSIYFLGAAPGIAQKTALKLKKINPGLKIAGAYAGVPDDKEVFNNLLKTKPDILLVAFGAPKQDKFIYNLKLNYSDLGFGISDLPRVAVGVGGTFDYISGAVSRAPFWMRSLGLEWLYRLIRQPKRVGRIFRAVFVFPIVVIFSRSKSNMLI